MISEARVSWNRIVAQALAAGIAGGIIFDLYQWATTLLPRHASILVLWGWIASTLFGKAALTGFTLDFGGPLDVSAAGDAANYQVDTVTTKKVKKKVEHILHPITKFTVSYSAAHNAVTIALGSPEAFPKGGQVTVLGSVTGSAGSGTVFTISKGGKSITPG